MEKLVQLKKYLPEIAFVALLIRVLVAGTGIGEALAFISLVVSMGYTKWLEKGKVDQMTELEERLKMMESRISSLYVDKGVRTNKDEEKSKSVLSKGQRYF